jgi:hypothetical protein
VHNIWTMCLGITTTTLQASRRPIRLHLHCAQSLFIPARGPAALEIFSAPPPMGGRARNSESDSRPLARPLDIAAIWPGACWVNNHPPASQDARMPLHCAFRAIRKPVANGRARSHNHLDNGDPLETQRELESHGLPMMITRRVIALSLQFAGRHPGRERAVVQLLRWRSGEDRPSRHPTCPGNAMF